MIPVFVREAEDLLGYKLGEFYPSDMSILVECFKEHPIYIGEAGLAALSEARFICERSGAFFEILVSSVD